MVTFWLIMLIICVSVILGFIVYSGWFLIMDRLSHIKSMMDKYLETFHIGVMNVDYGDLEAGEMFLIEHVPGIHMKTDSVDEWHGDQTIAVNLANGVCHPHADDYRVTPVYENPDVDVWLLDEN